jgi:pyruvate dehydrogenase E2 component (dihydrolipoamide acetyltransferase)
VCWQNPGDQIKPGDVLADIETDKATLEWEAQEDGYLAKHLIGAPALKIKVGTPVAVLVTNREDINAFAVRTTSQLTLL